MATRGRYRPSVVVALGAEFAVRRCLSCGGLMLSHWRSQRRCVACTERLARDPAPVRMPIRIPPEARAAFAAAEEATL